MKDIILRLLIGFGVSVTLLLIGRVLWWWSYVNGCATMWRRKKPKVPTVLELLSEGHLLYIGLLGLDGREIWYSGYERISMSRNQFRLEGNEWVTGYPIRFASTIESALKVKGYFFSLTIDGIPFHCDRLTGEELHLDGSNEVTINLNLRLAIT